MPILNYTTSIPVEKTMMEIQVILKDHGAKKFITDYNENGHPSALFFSIYLNDMLLTFSLPANYQGVLRAMKSHPKVKRSLCNEEQAIRVSWRIIKDWINAQMGLIDAELADLAEVFLPYAISNDGSTLYKYIQKNQTLLLTE